jgi:hypothetical protein
MFRHFIVAELAEPEQQSGETKEELRDTPIAHKYIPPSGFTIAKDYTPPFLTPDSTRFFRSTEFETKINHLLQNCAHKKDDCGTGSSFAEEIAKLNVPNCYIAGGVIRDLLVGLSPKDIDLKFTHITSDRVIQICNENNWECPVKWFSPDKTETYVKFLPDVVNGFDGLEGQGLHVKYNLGQFENNVNALMYDVKQCVIVDFFGDGVEWALAKRFRIPRSAATDWGMGQRQTLKAVVRVFKMLEKGFTLDNPEWFVQLWKDKMPQLVLNVYPETNISIINYVLLVTIRGDDIDRESGIFTKKGRRIKKFQRVLKAIRDFNPEIFSQIVNEIMKVDTTLKVPK